MAAPTKPATRRFFLPTRSRPHMAHSGHRAGEFQCPLLGAKRTSLRRATMSVIDPQETCAALKKAVFVPLLKRDTVLSVVLKARAHTTQRVQSRAPREHRSQLPLPHDKEARHRPQRVKRA